MKHLQLFNTFQPILESYRDIKRSDYSNKYEHQFAEYALNEKPLHWDEAERAACRALYGNREVGVVYHGNRINDESNLQKLEEIKSGLAAGEHPTYFMGLKSVSPYRDEAESFALYVKSYDEATTFRMIQSAVYRGSSGRYGSFLITVKPTAEQVILANFGEGKRPKTSAETEAIIYGDVEVVDIHIYYPLTKETYLEQFKEMSPLALFNDFYYRWFSEKKLPRPDSSYIISLLSKIDNEEEAISFVTRLYKGGFVFSFVTSEEFLACPQLKSLLKYITVNDENGRFIFNFTTKKVGASSIKGLGEYLATLPKYKKLTSSKQDEILTRPFKITAEISVKRHMGIYFQLDSNARIILRILVNYKERGITKKHPIINEFNVSIKNMLDELIMGKHISDVDDQTLSDMDGFLHSLYYELQGGVPSVIDMSYIRTVMRYLYSDFAHRYSSQGDDEFSYKLRLYGKLTAYALKIMSL